MKNRTSRRPFSRPSRSSTGSGGYSAPVLQALEPRKLLTTLYANADLDAGETDSFYGWVAMPTWVTGQTLNASSVEERSVRLGIRIIDPDITSHASISIFDLRGNTLFPWTGVAADNTETTEITVATGAGDDGHWGSDDDEETDAFALDAGYNPGWRVAVDSQGNFIPGVWIPDSEFNPVRRLEWLEDADPPDWDFETIPDQFEIVIPETGYWDPGADTFYGTGDDARLPAGFGFPGAGTDDRIFNTADDQWVIDFAGSPWLAPDTDTFEPHLVDRQISGALADDGVPDFNNGIGRIVLSGTTITTRISFFIIEDFTNFDPASPEAFDPFTLPEDSHIGIALVGQGVYQSPAMGSIVIGNPTHADWSVLNSMGNLFPLGFQQYDRSNEGFFMEDPSLNETVGRIAVDGALYGNSEFAGAVDILHVGYFGGNVTVDGDMDALIVAGDSSFINIDGGTDTRGFLRVGRVLGSFVVGGVMSTQITVQGDFDPEAQEDKPFLRADKTVIEHERDFFPGDEPQFKRNFASANLAYLLTPEGEEVEYLRNDTRATAQYVGREVGYSAVSGVLGTDPFDDQHTFGDGGDDIDYYSVAVRAGQEIIVDLNVITLMTIQDVEGLVLASRGDTGTTGSIIYTPNETGLLYIVIENTAGFGGPGQAYQMTVSGAAASTLGEIRAMGDLRYSIFTGSSITSEVGSIGTVRVGMNAGADDDVHPFIGNVLISAGANIWNVTSGGSIGVFDQSSAYGSGSTEIVAAQNIGQILAGFGVADDGAAGFHGGSIGATVINAGLDIGTVWAHAAGGPGQGVDEQTYTYGDLGGIARGDGSTLVVFTEVSAGGSIGVIRADSRILADPDPAVGLAVRVGRDGIIDLFETASRPYQDFDLTAPLGDSGVVGGQALINTGIGSNVRFFRSPFVWANGVEGAVFNVTTGQAFTVVDDSGALYTIKVTGVGSFAQVVTHAVGGSIGVATARITAFLGTNGRLTVTNNSGFVEIGDVIVTGGGNNGQVRFDGTGRTDIYMLRAFGGVNRIENRTDGDIVAIDTDGVNRVRLGGNLGRTLTHSSMGPINLRGPRYQIAETGGAVGAELLYSSSLYGSGADPDLGGAPFDHYLNGLAIRDGGFVGNNGGRIFIDGTIVDIISEVTLGRVVANFDRTTPFGDFHGVEGTIYSEADIVRLSLGDGLVDAGSGLFINGLVSAGGLIRRVDIEGEGHDIYGIINGFGGVNLVSTRNGSNIDGADIWSTPLDSFFTNPATNSGDGGGGPVNDINRIRMTDGDLVNSRIRGVNVNQVRINRGIWDSNRLRADGGINIVRADEFNFQYASAGGVNLITAVQNINRIETNGRKGDINDLTIDTTANFNNLRGNKIDGVVVNADEQLGRIDARAAINRSVFTAGALNFLNAMDDVERVTVNVAGPLRNFRSRNGSIIRLDMLIDGPDGRLDLMDARHDITGEMDISGPVKTIRTREGDIRGRLTTFSGDGNINQLFAGRDLVVDLDVDGDLKLLKANRNMMAGGTGTILIRGDLRTADARNGSFAGSLIVDNAVTGSITFGTFTDGSKVAARARIANLSVDSDVNGTIQSFADGLGRVDIDGNFTGTLEARNAEIENATIRGNFSGLINGDDGIRLLNIMGDATGRIRSGQDIDRIDIDGNTSAFSMIALQNISNANIDGNVSTSILGAGALIDRFDVGGNVTDSSFVAGLESLGVDFALGGQGEGLDTYTSGDIDDISIDGNITNTNFAAGVNAGSDGSFATLDADTDLLPGRSDIGSVTVGGTATGTNFAVADTTIGSVSVIGGGPITLIELDQAPLALTNGIQFADGSPVTFVDTDGDTITLTMRGPGTGIYTLANVTSGNLTGLVFNGTTTQTTFQAAVTSADGNGVVDLDNVHVQFADDAQLNAFTLEGHLDGTDALTIDGSVNTLTLMNVTTTGVVSVGGLASRIITDVVGSTVFNVTRTGTFDVQTGNFAGRLNSEIVQNFNVRNGEIRGVVWGRDSIGSINTNNMVRAKISTRGSINSVSANSLLDLTWITAGDDLVRVNLNGDMVESFLSAGFSLGADGIFGGTLADADLLTAGDVLNVNIRGSFIQSSIGAGVDRGEDEFFGTEDDTGALGLSNVNMVQVTGQALGSNFNSQHYAVTAAGTVQNWRVGGDEFFAQGNMTRDFVRVTPIPLRVQRVVSRIDVETFFLDIYFNEDVDVSTILLDPGNPQAGSAITFENPVDPNGVTPNPIDDYTFTYFEDERRLEVRFFRSFSLVNPGVYTLVIDGSAIRSSSNINLDADGDGVTGDDFLDNFAIGDAGDRTVEGTWDPDNDPNTPNTVEFDAALDMDLLLDDLIGGTGIKNNSLTLTGTIGDHADEDSFYFPAKFDVDVYSITLEAGDIFRATLDLLEGSPFVGSVSLRNDTGGIVASEGTLGTGYVVITGGTFFVTVAGTSLGGGIPGLDELIDISNANGMFTPPIIQAILPDDVSNDIGAYVLTVNIFDDGNTGFILADPLTLVDGEALVTEGFIGYDINGAPVNAFTDADVYDISGVLLDDNTTTTQLEEGMTLTVTLRLSEVGGDMGGRYDVGIFQTTETTAIFDALLMGAPGPFIGDDTRLFSTHTDITISFKIPEAGTYSIMVQGTTQTNYELIVTVDTATQGDRFAQPRTQNVLLETEGGFADWFGVEGTEISAFDLSLIGFDGLESTVISRIIDNVETWYEDQAGVITIVSTNPADFAGEEFTTIFLTNYNDGPGSWGIASSLDPQNQNESNEAIVFLPGFAQFVTPGQVDGLADMLSRVITHELGHTLGLRHAFNPNPFGPVPIMGSGSQGAPPVPRQFLGDPNDPYNTAMVLEEFFFGLQNEVDLLQLIFDVDA